MSDKPVIGFLGLGHMGLPMAINLHRAGYQLKGFDVVPAAVQAAQDAGIETVGSGAEAAVDVDIVLTMFPSGQHVLDAYAQYLLKSAKPNTLFLECSTIDVAQARQAAELAVAAGHRSADAPVSGGVVGAEAGTLTFMLGAQGEDLEEITAVLEHMGKRIVHCGGYGAGQAAKVCNNMLLGISMIGAAEAFVLGERLGLEHQALYDVISSASGQCWAVTTNCPVPGPVPTSPANRDYQPGFAAALMAKDLGLAASALEHTTTDAQLGSLAAALYRKFSDEGNAGTDFSGIINAIRDGSL
ncbi:MULTISPECIES: 3-hydroxyisobutyrate dehydrogenase [Glutamicibacter]|jgi:3-hydroxyisobutyrate dehydrogenase|uniref:3-hydroxyisobutyrate dehydrogenase n=1 Tax=Glutamicibacter halophytocola TaxID=1933880 RepID=A0A5B8IN09_9MICC|nr:MULTISPECIES: 3-hydroxyisobutyrate dehydrogenase [Glutamicibacter]ALG27716.1 3-hydroxyisobutyrate dehydrogenase [Glutamicibacter halophytocola]MBF6672100.1 3-hydroxyisobutyrate dehydrogenase [Glutamicibacter sp. FBE19]NQD41615.1 3-hydroxyisobutyrate dehydrogenase [Glutamicibacter halophytocola]QDY67094.1 3-hydroxyisobutyrate dehydrogenase [Glutamicibacter halophytocola]UUX59266.1 3-hydroxyisobutyrate dehydrogenase [Glutamicibacter halophytocola]